MKYILMVALVGLLFGVASALLFVLQTVPVPLVAGWQVFAAALAVMGAIALRRSSFV